MSVPIKRKRGRPRHDEPREINDCDIALIAEFKLRPAFYDRTHPQYRNRDYLEPLWVEIGQKLGFTVSSVKNRMLQLRNRYNLEKRRIESLQDQYQEEVNSQWLLYDSLSFLGDHIKTRRVFAKSMAAKQLRNKMHHGSSTSTDDCDEFDEPEFVNGNGTVRTAATTSSNNHHRDYKQSMRRNVSAPAAAATTASSAPAAGSVVANSKANGRHTIQNDECTATNYSGVDKYKAFGQFIVSSLIELNENDALRLVERFTGDIVQTLMLEQKPNHSRQSYNFDSSNIDK